MYVDPQDTVPDSMLQPARPTASALVGGLAMMIGAHVIVPVSFFAVLSALAATGIASTEPQVYVDDHIIEARFVRLGKPPEPNKLPERKVPIKSTAPDNAKVISKKNDPPPPEKVEKKVEPEDPEEDLLARLGDRAQEFAEIAERAEAEGDPEGVDWGTETEAQAGDIYRGKLVAFFKRGWTIPTTLGDTSELSATASVEITRDLKVGASEVVKSSGEALFDQSIEDRFAELRALGTTIPEPPIEAAQQFIGQTITVRFHGQSR